MASSSMKTGGEYPPVFFCYEQNVMQQLPPFRKAQAFPSPARTITCSRQSAAMPFLHENAHELQRAD
jgi:hypothetical protein